jgi:hypothetical protein
VNLLEGMPLLQDNKSLQRDLIVNGKKPPFYRKQSSRTETSIVSTVNEMILQSYNPKVVHYRKSVESLRIASKAAETWKPNKEILPTLIDSYFRKQPSTVN